LAVDFRLKRAGELRRRCGARERALDQSRRRPDPEVIGCTRSQCSALRTCNGALERSRPGYTHQLTTSPRQSGDFSASPFFHPRGSAAWRGLSGPPGRSESGRWGRAWQRVSHPRRSVPCGFASTDSSSTKTTQGRRTAAATRETGDDEDAGQNECRPHRPAFVRGLSQPSVALAHRRRPEGVRIVA
jgi:hypothetical protein